MTARTVISFAMDLVRSTEQGLKMNEIQFRRYNKAIINQIWPYLKKFNLEDSRIKFTGDGWLLFNPDLEKARAVVAFAKTIQRTFQKDIADTLTMDMASVPSLRMAICTGDDEEITFGNEQKDWVGDSARRATRAACAPNLLIVNATIQEKVFRAFSTEPISWDNFSVKRVEEDFQIYSVGDIRHDFIDELKNESDPAEWAPYTVYLQIVGEPAKAEQAFAEITKGVMENRGALSLPTSAPAKIATLADVGTQMRKLLYSAPTKKMRDEIVKRMKQLDVPPSVPVYNSLIHRSSNYSDALEWFERLKQDRFIPDVITYNTLINLSPDLPTAERWLKEMREAGVKPDEVTYSTLINLSPDLPTAERWLKEMREAGVKPDEVTYNTLINLSPDLPTAERWLKEMREAGFKVASEATSAAAIKVTSIAEADRLTQLLGQIGAEIGRGYYAALYSRVALLIGPGEFLEWHGRQIYRDGAALEPVIRQMASKSLVSALRIVFVFPYLQAARKVMREHEHEANEYFTNCLDENFQPYNATYALGYCLFEQERLADAKTMYERALKLSTNERRSTDILARLDEINLLLGP